MNAWVVFPVIGLIALLYVIVPVSVAMAQRYRGHKLVHCPMTGRAALVDIRRAGLAEALGLRGLRQVGECSLWPERRHCGQECRLLADEEIRQPPVGAA